MYQEFRDKSEGDPMPEIVAHKLLMLRKVIDKL